MKAWRKAAEGINKVRRMIAVHNSGLPRAERVAQLPPARVSAQRQERWQRETKGKALRTTWLLSGLMVRGGYQPAP